MKLVFLTYMYEQQNVAIYSKKTKSLIGSLNPLQESLIEGFSQCLSSKDWIVINSYPFAAFPKYRQLLFRTKEFFIRKDGIGDINIGFINVQGVKQLQRRKKVFRILRKMALQNPSERIHVLIYGLYSPYLWAAWKIKKRFPNFSFTVLVTDLPLENGMPISNPIKRFEKKIDGALQLKYLKAADQYVLLSAAMSIPLSIKSSNDFIVMEGIFSQKDDDTILAEKLHLECARNRVFLYTGTIDTAFGIDVLLSAFHKLRNENIRLFFCGSGDSVPIVKAFCKKDPRIVLFGFLPRNQILALQREATFLINPRQNVGEYVKYSFPSKTMEYLASGTPTLMYKLAGIPDDYFRYINILIGNTDQELFDDLDKYLNADYSQLKEKAIFGKNFVLAQKNPKVQVKKIIDFMKKNEK